MPLTRLEKTPRRKPSLRSLLRILVRSLRSLAIIAGVVLLVNTISRGFDALLDWQSLIASNRNLIGLIVAVIVGLEIWREVR